MPRYASNILASVGNFFSWISCFFWLASVGSDRHPGTPRRLILGPLVDSRYLSNHGHCTDVVRSMYITTPSPILSQVVVLPARIVTAGRKLLLHLTISNWDRNPSLVHVLSSFHPLLIRNRVARQDGGYLCGQIVFLLSPRFPGRVQFPVNIVPSLASQIN